MKRKENTQKPAALICIIYSICCFCVNLPDGCCQYEGMIERASCIYKHIYVHVFYTLAHSKTDRQKDTHTLFPSSSEAVLFSVKGAHW